MADPALGLVTGSPLRARIRDQADFIPIEMRPCKRPDFSALGDPSAGGQQRQEPRQAFWMRAKGALGDDPALHRCVAAYASDFGLLRITMLATRSRKTL